MKKKLLLQLVALFCVAAGYAYEVNSYIYTPDSKFKVLGANQFTNGNFATGSTSGWQDGTGGSVDASVWSVVPGIGPNGEYAVQSQGATAGVPLVQVFSGLVPGVYILSYDVKSADETYSTTTTVGTNNYLDFFVNIDGSTAKGEVSEGYPRTASTANSFNTEWKTITDTVTIESGEILVFRAEQLNTGVALTNFSVQQVGVVFDTRAIERRIQFAEELLENPNFPTNADILRDDVDWAKDAISGEGEENPDDFDAMSEVLETLNASINVFLDDNSADLLELGYFTYGKITQVPNFNAGNSGGAQGDWRFEAYSGSGNRWGHRSADTDNLNGGANGLSRFNYAIQSSGSYQLGRGAAFLEKAGLEGGLYMVGFDLMGNIYSSAYNKDFDTQIEGVKIFLNNDSVDVGPIDTRNYRSYYMIAQLQEGDTLRAGVYFPGVERGAIFYVSNNVLRLVGSSADNEAYKLRVKNLKEQQAALIQRIELATADADQATTQLVWFSDEETQEIANMPWGRAALRDSVAKYQEVYNASLSVVDADGNVQNPDAVVQEYIDELLAAVRALNTARNNFTNLNAPYNTLVEELKVSNRMYNAFNDAGDQTLRQEFVNVLIEAFTLVANVTDEEQGEAFTDVYNRILTAKTAYWNTAAYYDLPAVQPIINGSNTTGNITGWEATIGPSAQAWRTVYTGNQSGNNDSFESGHGFVAWRGNTVSPNAKLVQTITVNYPGVYEYRAQAYAFNEAQSRDSYMIEQLFNEDGIVIDTLFTPSQCKLFFGLNGVPDSVHVHSHYAYNTNGTTKGGYVASYYSVVFIKETHGDELYEFGMDTHGQVDGQGANAFGFSSNQVLFGGEVGAYTTAAKADLNKRLSDARNLIAGKDTEVYPVARLVRFIAHAEEAVAGSSLTAILNAHHDLKEAMLDVDANSIVVDAIGAPEARTATEKAIVNGVFTVTGVKVANSSEGLKSLPKGLYIIDGKKYMVK